jgi:hypothetical protein
MINEIKELNLNDAIKFLNEKYQERFTIADYYIAYYYVCEKFNKHEVLLPHREYRLSKWKCL